MSANLSFPRSNSTTTPKEAPVSKPFLLLPPDPSYLNGYINDPRRKKDKPILAPALTGLRFFLAGAVMWNHLFEAKLADYSTSPPGPIPAKGSTQNGKFLNHYPKHVISTH